MHRSLRFALPALIVVAALGWFSYQYFIVADAPEEISTSAALDQLTQDLADEDAATQEPSEIAEPTPVPTSAPVADTDESDPNTADTAPATSTIDGTWTVDDDFGDFAFENASGSFAGFRVDKELFVGGVQVAVGRSGDVTGSILVDGGTIAGGDITVTTTTMESDIGARSNSIRTAIQASEFPTATFSITTSTPIDTARLEAGETVAADIAGALTIAGTTSEAIVFAEATMVEPGLALIVGSANLTWADFGVQTPNSSAGTVADQGTLEFQLIVRLS